MRTTILKGISIALIPLLIAGAAAGLVDIEAGAHGDAGAQTGSDDTTVRTNTQTNAQAQGSLGGDLRETGERTRDRIGGIVNDTRDQLRERDRNETRNETCIDCEQTRSGILAQARERIMNATDDARVQIQARIASEHEANYKKERQRYEAQTHEYEQARERLAATGLGANSKIGFEVRQRVALGATGRLDAYLGMLENRVNASDAYNATEKERILAQLHDYGDWLANVSAQVEAADSTANLSGVIGDANSRWAHVQSYARFAAGRSVLAKAAEVQAQAERASQRVQDQIQVVADAGGNVTAAERLKTQFDLHLNASAQHIANADTAYGQANSTSDAAYVRARAEIDAAKQELRDAYAVLRRIVAELHSERAAIGAEAAANVSADANTGAAA